MSTTPEEVWAFFRETVKELREDSRETDRQLRELKTQLGGLGEKLGYFAEGLALPSMEKILGERFGMTTFVPRLRVRKGARTIELDLLAWSDEPPGNAVIVEVKSRVRRDSIDQLKRTLTRFREFFPEHGNRPLLGIIAGVDWDEGTKDEALSQGMLVARVQDEMFELETPEGFQPRYW